MPDERPRGRARPADELVQELDREEESDEAGEPAPAPDAGLTGRPWQTHLSELTS